MCGVGENFSDSLLYLNLLMKSSGVGKRLCSGTEFQDNTCYAGYLRVAVPGPLEGRDNGGRNLWPVLV